jgi:hypothetical protein
MSLYVGDRLVCRFGWNEFYPNQHTRRSPTYSVTYTRYHINTIDSPDDEHSGARKM